MIDGGSGVCGCQIFVVALLAILLAVSYTIHAANANAHGDDLRILLRACSDASTSPSPRLLGGMCYIPPTWRSVDPSLLVSQLQFSCPPLTIVGLHERRQQDSDCS